jgi:cupin fold WbuC family metalloprotein
VSDEVLYPADLSPRLGRAEIEALAALGARNARRIARFCAHPDEAAALHEMFIVHRAGAYIPPHRHPGRPESGHVIVGAARLVFFDDGGAVEEVLPLGDYASGRTFYVRIEAPRWHTLLIDSEIFAFHEVTLGPFRPENSEFAPWAPPRGDARAAHWLADLHEKIRSRAG